MSSSAAGAITRFVCFIKDLLIIGVGDVPSRERSRGIPLIPALALRPADIGDIRPRNPPRGICSAQVAGGFIISGVSAEAGGDEAGRSEARNDSGKLDGAAARYNALIFYLHVRRSERQAPGAGE
jgi:hypothetical protein